MSAKRNHYQILGIATNVSAAEIKRAYRRLAKQQHPDAQATSEEEAAINATEQMIAINEAYATLRDSIKRAEYDAKIGLKTIVASMPKRAFSSMDEEQERAKFLQSTFHPLRSAIAKLIAAYPKELRELSADPYDEELTANFESYVNKLEEALRNASDSFTRTPTPRSLQGAVQMMRYSIAQAADGLEELRYFCGNYDYNHLTMAENLFRIAADLSKQALGLTKGS